MPSLVDEIRAEALRQGFARVAFAKAAALPEAQKRLAAWLELGYGGEMTYLGTAGLAGGRTDPRALLASAKTVIACAARYGADEPASPTSASPDATEPDGPRGRIARYARGSDYHHALRARLHALGQFIGARGGQSAYRVCVDTAPLLEREVAARAGLGFIAKNTMLISPGVGSYTVLGELVTTLELPADEAEPSRCGRCTSCLDVCPTGALVGERWLDARRCISYLTIELDGPIPRELRPLVGDWIFGCDLCQEVCPFNTGDASAALVPLDLRPRPSHSRPSLHALLSMNANQFRRYVERTALRRVRRRQLLRNVCVALGNVGAPADWPILHATLLGDRAPLVRGHAAWALGHLGAPAAWLEQAAAAEPDPFVRAELKASLDERDATPYVSSR